MVKATTPRRSTRLATQSKRNAVVTKRIAKCPKPMPRRKKQAVFNNPKALVNTPPNKRRPHLGNDDFNTPTLACVLAEKVLNIKVIASQVLLHQLLLLQMLIF